MSEQQKTAALLGAATWVLAYLTGSAVTVWAYQPEPWVAACAEAREAPTDSNLHECLGW